MMQTYLHVPRADAGGDRNARSQSASIAARSESAREAYLQSHIDSVAVIPGTISGKDAEGLREAVDRRWRNLDPAEVKRLAVRQAVQEGEADDNLVEATDWQPSYSADIISGGLCAADDKSDPDKEFMTQRDCAFAQKLLREHVTPAVERQVKAWRSKGATDLPGKLYACDSFVKRYLPGERHSLHAHRDMSSLVTANVLLSDPEDFQGGLEMYPEADELSAETLDERNGYLEEKDVGNGVLLEHREDGTGIGELVLHRGSLWHGVRMLEPERSRRYTWITWYSPNEADCKSDD